jgi:hypothetical protein
MTLRTKTLWYATQLAADVVDATLTALPTITIYTENSSRTFRSVQVWLSYADISTATGATVGEHRCACSVNGAAATTITELDDIAHSGENMAGILGPFDFTAHFTANYPAADSTTLALSVYFDITTGTGLNVRNVGALIAVTYEFDDGAATQYNTAIIPMESTTGALATAETEIGTNQIPQLTGAGGLLENVAGVVVRQQFFVVEGNDETGGAGTTDYTLNVRIDTGTTHAFGISEKALGSDCYKRFIHIESPSASAAHAWKAWTASSADLNHCTHTMYVTYQWTVSGTTEFLNSIMLPFEIPSPMGGSAAGDNDRFELPIRIEEPGTITLKQSAYRIQFVPGVGVLAGLNSRAGGQAYRAYTPAATVICGGSCFQQRVDSGSAQGAGLALARGKNNLVIDLYRTDTTDLGWNISGVAIINYKSGISAQGAGAHNHTTWWKVLDWDAALTFLRDSAAFAPNIPEASYWVTGIGFQMVHWDAGANNGIVWAAQVLSGEGAEDGWRDLYADIFIKDAERACQIVYCRARGDMKRWPNDTDSDRLAIETARVYRYTNAISCAKGVAMMLTYHTITFTVGGDVSGSSGGTVDIDVYTEDGDEILHIGSTSRVGNGAWSLTWLDNVYNCYAEARESGTLLGRSDSAVAAGSP